MTLMKIVGFSFLLLLFFLIGVSQKDKYIFQNSDTKKADLSHLTGSQNLQTPTFKKPNIYNQGEFSMKPNPSSFKASEKRSPEKKNSLEKATLAGGCFWCVESDLEKLYGVEEVISGYSGGDVVAPSYKEVSSGKTGHLEAVQVIFDPKKITYSQILDAFWRGINPLDKDGQFVDRGFQYSTAIFYHNEEQRRLAEQSKRELKEKGPFKKEIATPIRAFKNFYRAEGYHQDYYKKSPLKYKYYRYLSGRDQFLKKTWKKFKDFRNSSPLKRDKEKISHTEKKAGDSVVKKTGNRKNTKVDKNGTGLDRANIMANKTIVYSRPAQEEIKSKLTDLQYKVTQEGATEPPFKNLYWNNKAEGIYVDIVSGEPLFSSLDKYDSGTGWPSFTKPLVVGNIVTKKDIKLFFPRTEIRSKYGDLHLGHLFNDGPPPTGLRYCVNSAALKFIPKDRLKQEGYGDFAFLFE